MPDLLTNLLRIDSIRGEDDFSSISHTTRKEKMAERRSNIVCRPSKYSEGVGHARRPRTLEAGATAIATSCVCISWINRVCSSCAPSILLSILRLCAASMRAYTVWLLYPQNQLICEKNRVHTHLEDGQCMPQLVCKFITCLLEIIATQAYEDKVLPAKLAPGKKDLHKYILEWLECGKHVGREVLDLGFICKHSHERGECRKHCLQARP